MKSKSPQHKTKKLPDPEVPEIKERRIDPHEVERDLEQQNEILNKLISRLRPK